MSSYPPASSRVTVVIPTYNRVADLGEAIASVLGQGFDGVTVLVADDCSTDGTEAYMRGLTDSRIVYRRNPRNLGIGKNWCDAVRDAATEYVALLMDDDRQTPGFLARRVRALDASRDAALTFSPYVNVDPGGKSLGVSRAFPVADGELLPAQRLLATTSLGGTHVGTMVFRRRALTAVLDRAEKYDLIVDSAFVTFLAVAERANGVFVSSPDLLMALHEGQMWNRRREQVYVMCDRLLSTLR